MRNGMQPWTRLPRPWRGATCAGRRVMPHDDPRAQLAALQAELVLGLTGQGARPEAFDRDRLAATAAALARKRARAVVRAWPALAGALGDRFAERFAAYAERSAIPAFGGPLADGHAFARGLAAGGELPDEGRLEMMAVGLRYVCCSSGLIPRRGVWFAGAWLRGKGRLVLAVRLPSWGERWIWAGAGGWGLGP